MNRGFIASLILVLSLSGCAYQSSATPSSGNFTDSFGSFSSGGTGGGGGGGGSTRTKCNSLQQEWEVNEHIIDKAKAAYQLSTDRAERAEAELKKLGHVEILKQLEQRKKDDFQNYQTKWGTG